MENASCSNQSNDESPLTSLKPRDKNTMAKYYSNTSDSKLSSSDNHFRGQNQLTTFRSSPTELDVKPNTCQIVKQWQHPSNVKHNENVNITGHSEYSEPPIKRAKFDQEHVLSNKSACASPPNSNHVTMVSGISNHTAVLNGCKTEADVW